MKAKDHAAEVLVAFGQGLSETDETHHQHFHTHSHEIIPAKSLGLPEDGKEVDMTKAHEHEKHVKAGFKSSVMTAPRLPPHVLFASCPALLWKLKELGIGFSTTPVRRTRQSSTRPRFSRRIIERKRPQLRTGWTLDTSEQTHVHVCFQSHTLSLQAALIIRSHIISLSSLPESSYPLGGGGFSCRCSGLGRCGERVNESSLGDGVVAWRGRCGVPDCKDSR